MALRRGTPGNNTLVGSGADARLLVRDDADAHLALPDESWRHELPPLGD